MSPVKFKKLFQVTSDMKSHYKLNVSLFILVLVILSVVFRMIMYCIIDISKQGGDSIYYIHVAKNIAEIGMHISADSPYYRVPLYPFFLSLFYENNDVNVFHVLVTQSIAGIIVPLLVYFSTRKFDENIARISSLITALLPGLVFMEFRILSETMSVLLFLSGFTFLMFARNGRSIVHSVASGVFFGLAALSTQILMLFPIFMLITAFLLRDRRIKECFIVVMISVIVITPWAFRNYLIDGKELFLSKGTFGFNLWVGTWETGENWMVEGIPAHAYGNEAERLKLWAEGKRSDKFLETALETIQTQPLKTFGIWVARAPHQWFGSRSDLSELNFKRHSKEWYIFKLVLWGLNCGYIILFLAGLIINWKKKVIPTIFFMPIMYIALVYLPFHNSETRYSTVALPFMAVFVTIAIFKIIQIMQRGENADGSRARL